MEALSPTPSIHNEQELTQGCSVIYALHGKCRILSVETRQLEGQAVRFYKLEVKRSAQARVHRQDTAIWVPVMTARKQGLRAPMDRTEAENAINILTSREYFFQLAEPWAQIMPQLETCIRVEGGYGLAKVFSYLYVLKRKQIVPSSDIMKLEEMVHRLLFRELSEALGEPAKVLEEKTARGLRSKLLADS